MSSRITDRELRVLINMTERAVSERPDYRHGQNVLSALKELEERRENEASQMKSRP